MNEPQKPPRELVKPEAGSRLETLAAAYRDAKRRADEVNAQLDEIKNALKVELINAKQGAEDIVLWTPVLERPLRLHHVEGAWRIDSKRMKREDPQLYVKWAVQGNPTWKLEAA